jgi:hypothetical protein
MNETTDPLDAELRAFQPPEISAELRQRIGRQLVGSAEQKDRRLWRIALAGGLAAACLGGFLLALGSRNSGNRPAVVGPVIAPPGPTEDDVLPSLRAYRQALARSPEDLDALLDRHAARGSGPDPQLERIRAFNRPDVEVRAFSGEL